MAGGHSESAHSLFVEDSPVGTGHGQREKWQIHTGQETGIGIMVGYASEDDMAFTHSMTRMVICGG